MQFQPQKDNLEQNFTIIFSEQLEPAERIIKIKIVQFTAKLRL